MKHRLTFTALSIVLILSGIVLGENNRSKYSSPAFVLDQSKNSSPESVERELSITNGTRSILTEYNDGTGGWYFSYKSMGKYQNGHLIRSGSFNGVVDYLYDQQNHLLELHQYNDGIATWIIQYSYSLDGKPLGNLQLYWVSGHLDTVYQSIYSTNSNGFILQQLTQQYSGGQWINNSRLTFTRDASGNQITRLVEFWSNASWSPSSLDSSVYANTLIAESISRYYSSGVWTNYSRRTYSYDGNGDLSQIMIYQWITDHWYLSSRDTYTTQPDRNIIVLWPNTTQTFYSSDSIVVAWTSSGVSSVTIALSTNNGAAWSVLVSNRVDTSLGFYTYHNTTSINSTQCLIRVSDATDASLHDQSGLPFTLVSVVSSVIHQTGTVQLSVFSTGDFGSTNGTVSTGAGFNFKGSGHPLYAGGVIVGTASSGLYGVLRSFSINDLSMSILLTGLLSNAKFDEISDETFTLPSAVAPLTQLAIRQLTYSKTGTDYVYCIYTVKNSSPSSSLTGLYVGMTADWDIGNAQTNLGGIVAGKNLVYQFNQNGAVDPNYYGVVSLNNFVGGKITDSAFTQTGRVTGWPWISKIASENTVTPTDYRSFIGSGPFYLPAQASVQVGFALVGASSLSELQLKADTLIKTWNSGFLAVGKSVNVLPREYSLSQNFPNPFNPSTTIRYGLPNRGSVRIVITNVLGQQVATLENGEQEAGSYEVEWRANAASGMYFYRIDAVSSSDPNNRFIQVKKMLLVR